MTNDEVITRAFARFRGNVSKICQEGMIRLAKAGLDYLVSAHNEHAMFMAHTTEDNTMGWAVSFNGKVVASGAYEGNGDTMPGSAEQTAASILASTTGWVAVILSEMEGYYRVDYEMDFLNNAKITTRAEFQTYFKKIA